MRKKFFAFMMFLPTFAFADVDVSGCEVIGYMKSSITECTTMEFCQKEFGLTKDQELFDRCVKRIKTPEECAEYIAQQQEMARKELLIYKCPMTDELLKFKTQEWRDTGGIEKWALYNDGTSIDTDAMIADDESAYLFRVQVPVPVLMPLHENTIYGYDIIGPADKHGMMFSFIKEN